MIWVGIGVGAFLLLVLAAGLWKWRKGRAVRNVNDAIDTVSDAEEAAAMTDVQLEDAIEDANAAIGEADTLDRETDALISEAADAAAEMAMATAGDDEDGDVPGGDLARELVP